MESIEQPVFDSIGGIGQGATDVTGDRAELIEAARKKKKRMATQNGDSPTAENSPLHQPDNNTSILCSPQNYGLRVIIVSSVVFSLAVTVALILTIYLAPQEVNGNAAVVAGDRQCASVGLQALEDGGNAVDAAVATAFCLAVVEPQHSGLAGGGFALVHDHKFDKTNGYDFRESLPSAFTWDMLDQPNADLSVNSAGVPGLVKGLATMHKKHGKLEWKDLVQPSVDLAENGFRVSEDLAISLQQQTPNQFNTFSDFQTDGKWKSVNDTVTLKYLAETLGKIRDDPDALYTGKAQSLFVKEVNDKNGIITAEDLKNYRVINSVPLKMKLKDLTVLTMPAPTSGPLLSLILSMAQKFITKKVQRKDVKAKTYHQLIETFKFAFGQYEHLGEADYFSDSLVTELVAKMGNETHTDASYYGTSQVFGSDGGTSHISVIDSSELMVSLTLSTGDVFGNKILLPNSGIILSNSLGDFSTLPNHPSSKTSATRPPSTMCPTIVYNKDHPCDQRLVMGGLPGANTITGLAQTIINNILFGDKLAAALSAPRVHNQLFPNSSLYEDGFPSQIVTDLIKMGHDMKKVDTVASQVTAIRKSNDDITVGIDPRSRSGEDHY